MDKTPAILLVEDNELASELLYNFLLGCGFKVTPVFTATDCISRLKNEIYDLLVLDLNLPDFNGYEVIKSIRHEQTLPIIITSAFQDTESKLLAFKFGATDYMIKPIDLKELEARIWVHLGRSTQIAIPMQEQKTLVNKNHTIYFKGEKLILTSTEYAILRTLLENENSVISRETLVTNLSSISSPRSLDNHIKNIRKKIEDDPAHPQYLKTEYGIGYILINS